MDYLTTNRAAWDVRTAQHVTSDFYDVEGWLAGATSLKSIELELLGDVTGLRVLHLMCHFGQDTLSLKRLGAASVVGLDLSPRAIAEARKLSERAGLEATFVEGDLYSAPERIDGQFDVVFMSYGTIGWLPDVEHWAEVVAGFVAPGGRFVFAEFHPALWMLDEDYRAIKYHYANHAPIVEEEGTYTDVAEEKPQAMVTWNHGLGEVIGALLGQGLSLKHFAEYDYSPYAIFGERGAELGPGEWGIKGIERKLPLVYSLVCERSAGR